MLCRREEEVGEGRMHGPIESSLSLSFFKIRKPITFSEAPPNDFIGHVAILGSRGVWGHEYFLNYE